MTIKVRADQSQAWLAKRIVPDVDVKLLFRAAATDGDRVLLQTAYAGGLRVSELVALTWSDVIARGACQAVRVLLHQGMASAP